LGILDEFGEKAIELPNFEQLRDVNPKLYSIRYPHSTLNPSILYVYLDEGKILLLAAFKEKSNKDYDRNKKIALSRLKILNE